MCRPQNSAAWWRIGGVPATSTSSSVAGSCITLPGVSRARAVSCRLTMTCASHGASRRSEEHTSELQSVMRISYAVFGLKNNKHNMIKNFQLYQIEKSDEKKNAAKQHYEDMYITTV